MMFKTHLFFGIFLSLVFLYFFTYSNPYLFVSLVCLGSVLVDIDSSHSKLGRKFKPLSWIFEYIFGHRGFLHSLVAAFLLLLLSLYLFHISLLAFALILGYLGHIFLDAFTINGVPLLKPFSDRRLSGPVYTGGMFEYLIFLLILVFDGYLFFLLFWYFKVLSF